VQSVLCMEVLSCLSENGFSLDELVIKTKKLFESKGMPGFVALLLSAMDENLCWRLYQRKEGWKPQPCCSSPRYDFVDRRRRAFRTSVGIVKVHWRRMRCRECGRRVIPLREFMGIRRYQTKSSELERTVAEVVSEQSYRRSCRHMEIIGDIPVAKSTAHRWVMESGCDEIKVDGRLVESLFADATGYKSRPGDGVANGNRGDLKVVLGVTSEGDVVPFGCYTQESWKDIGRQIRKQTLGAGPIARVLVSDGDAGLSRGLADLAPDQQRCHWHMERDLDFFMWKENAERSERRRTQKHLRGIIGIELPREDFQQVSHEDTMHIARSTAEAEEKIDLLIRDLIRRGYRRAAGYVRSAKRRLFTYIRLWLKHGLVCPRVSSMIERMIREIGRRLKKMAYGWSKKGAARMARIIIKRITSADQWEDYWRKRFRINDSVILAYRGVQIK